jgi:acetoin utilization deacetylase AcuC-like enzyme
MKIVYHPRYEAVYAGDPAAKAGRMENILIELPHQCELVTPEPAPLTAIQLVHTNWHIASVQKMSATYDIALLAAGGAVKAAGIAVAGEPSFGLIRPPGHHASPDHCWGFCFFNNMAISIAKLRQDGKIDNAVILDIDIHFGDGTENIFDTIPEVEYYHPEGRGRKDFVDSIATFLDSHKADIIAVSAGFDRHEDDWGGQLTTEDYHTIGQLVKDFSDKVCLGRRYGLLEGGYNHEVLGRNVSAFIEGMS